MRVLLEYQEHAMLYCSYILFDEVMLGIVAIISQVLRVKDHITCDMYRPSTMRVTRNVYPFLGQSSMRCFVSSLWPIHLTSDQEPPLKRSAYHNLPICDQRRQNLAAVNRSFPRLRGKVNAAGTSGHRELHRKNR